MLGQQQEMCKVAQESLNPKKCNEITEELIRLTPRQEELLEGVPEKFYISGPAGSGKTEMIISKASHPVLRDQNKLVLVSNRGIKLHLEKNRLNRVPNIEIKTFLGFLREITRNQIQEESTKTMVHRAAQILVDNPGIVPSYKSIFVDEAQDLENFDTWEIILKAVHNEGRNHYKWIFYDNNQMVHYTSQLEPENVYHLAQVIRNTINVFNESKRFHYSNKPCYVNHGIFGPDVTWLYFTNAQLRSFSLQVMGTLSTVVEELWKEIGQVCPGDILIALENKSRAEELRSRYKQQDGCVVPFDVEQMVRNICDRHWPAVPTGKCGVTIDSISRYKSLESKAVIVLIGLPNSQKISQLMYTGMTRSFCKLYVITSREETVSEDMDTD